MQDVLHILQKQNQMFKKHKHYNDTFAWETMTITNERWADEFFNIKQEGYVLQKLN